MNETTKRTRERRLHRDKMSEYVFASSQYFAAACALLGLGFSLLVMTIVMYGMGASLALAGFFFVIGMTFTFAGVGWLRILPIRWNDYFHDILDTVGIDEETTHKTKEQPQVGVRSVPYNTNGRSHHVEVNDRNPLTPSEWANIAHYILTYDGTISQVAMARGEHKIMTQTKFAAFSKYMNDNKFMQMVDGTNELTDRGKQYLSRFILNIPPTPQQEYSD